MPSATRTAYRRFERPQIAQNFYSLAVGAVASLRFGEAAAIYHFKSEGESDTTFGVNDIYAAYALWRPYPSLELDAGRFLSPFGVQVYESWRNPNYTRGAIANYAQRS